MPPRTAFSTSLRGWRCPHCTIRTFSTTSPFRAFGPEHPRSIEVPEPPQQTLPYLPPVKGSLPIPRNVFPGKDGLKKSSINERIALSTKRPKKKVVAEKGSREEWKQRLSESRRRNLEEGLESLATRTRTTAHLEWRRQKREKAERARLLAAPEREDERLITPSHGLDLQQLLHGGAPPDPNREDRLKHKARNFDLKARAKQAERLDHLHTLYMHARTFIVTPQQLDAAIEEEFSKDFQTPGGYVGLDVSGGGGSANSMWNYGAPMTAQDMLNRARGGPGGRFAVGGEGGMVSEVNAERVRRIAEGLTGGKMDG